MFCEESSLICAQMKSEESVRVGGFCKAHTLVNMLRWSAFLVILALQTVMIEAELNEDCITTSHQIGQCRLVKNCEYVLNILRNPNQTPEELYFIDHNKCGSTTANPRPLPLICCPLFYNVEKCGISKISTRVFGGTETIYGEIPWAGVIVYKINKKRSSVNCGCTLINSRWVITAAHCYSNVPSSWKIHSVRFSEYNTKQQSPCTFSNNVRRCRVEYEVNELIVHPSYQRKSMDMQHDIALISTKENIKFSDYVIPICLPFDDKIRELRIDKQSFTVTGWGQTEKENEAGLQRHVTIPGRNNSVCDEAFSYLNIKLTEQQICAGGESGQDSCRGDSGGSLTVQLGLVNYLVGIVSFGPQECGTANHPGIYTNVMQYLDWIEDIFNE
ncbi:CLIP domain-containing serine protease B15-like [Wyeomyia smithii]|uniref:CLIP domain-containing serine protease B15-like n=1 Tax=Wyeomyia smithii TaxID=174621 RepID=UPI002467E15C|nr:CLIP domain-containing serine protease B15-like [Wyeomyia smithii]